MDIEDCESFCKHYKYKGLIFHSSYFTNLDSELIKEILDNLFILVNKHNFVFVGEYFKGCITPCVQIIKNNELISLQYNNKYVLYNLSSNTCDNFDSFKKLYDYIIKFSI